MALCVVFLVSLLFSVNAANYPKEEMDVFKHFEDKFNSLKEQLELEYSDRFHKLTSKVASLENTIQFQQSQLDELKSLLMDMNVSETTGKTEPLAEPNNSEMNFIRVNNNTTKMNKSDDGPRNSEGNVVKRLLVPAATTEIPRPPVIAFSAYMSKTESHVVDHHILIFDTVQINEGNGYLKHAGTFVVPRSGIYVFTYTLVINSNGEVCTDLVINDAIYGHAYSYTGSLNVRQTGSSIVVVHVNQGDQVLVRTAIDGKCGQTGQIYGDTWRRSTFAGWIIG